MLDTFLGVLGLTVSFGQELKQVISNNINMADILTDAIAKEFNNNKEKIQILCSDKRTDFNKDHFKKILSETNFKVDSVDDLIEQLIPLVLEASWTPGLEKTDIKLNEIIKDVVMATTADLLSKISKTAHVANEILLLIAIDTNNVTKQVKDSVEKSNSKLEDIINIVSKLGEKASGVSKSILDGIKHTDHTVFSNGITFGKFTCLTTEKEFNENLYDLNQVKERLLGLTHRSREFYSVLLSKSNKPRLIGYRDISEVNMHEVIGYLGIGKREFRYECEILDDHRFIYNPEDGKNICLCPLNDNFHIAFSIREFCKQQKIDLYDVIVNLNFSHFDEK